jgi:cell division septum initiation protein DivIVA
VTEQQRPRHRADLSGSDAVDVVSKLDELAGLVENARSMPMSASCVVNRAEVLALVDEVRNLLPEELEHAAMVLRSRAELAEEGREEAQRLVAEGYAERARLVSQSEVMHEAEEQSADLRRTARADARAIRQEADDYVDTKLANFEIVLTKTLAAVQRGRDRLSGRSDFEDPEPLGAYDSGDERELPDLSR